MNLLEMDEPAKPVAIPQPSVNLYPTQSQPAPVADIFDNPVPQVVTLENIQVPLVPTLL